MLWVVGVGVDLHAVVAVVIEVESVGIERHAVEGDGGGG